MSWIEVEAETREEAESKLLSELGEADINNVEVEELKVVRKFLGMGGRTVRLRGKVKEAENEQQQTNVVADAPVDAPEEETNTPAASEKEATATEGGAEDKKPEPSESIKKSGSIYKPWASEGKSAIVIPPEGRGFGKRLYSADPFAEDQEEVENMDDRDSEERRFEENGFTPPDYKDDENSDIPEEVRTMAVEFVNSLLDGMSIDGDVKAYKLEDRLLVHIDSEDGGLLIGRKSETLDSLQYLTDIIVNRGRETRTRISLDVEHYKERRRFKIYSMAQDAAENAIQKSHPIRLQPMSPAERQIIHATLAENENVETISEGQGSRRRVVVHPVSGRKKPRRNSVRGRGR